MNSSYEKGKIYKIISDQTNNIYIGSTIQHYLCTRFAGHIRSYNIWKLKGGSYITSYELIELGDAQIILLENYNCDSKDQLRQREQYYIDLYKDIVVNKARAYSSPEYKKDQKNKHWKNHYKNNPEKYQKKRDDNKE